MRRYLLLVLLAATGLVASAQQAPPSGPGAAPAVTFRSDTNFVEVHAIVTDDKGAFVRGLTKDDFEVYENGKPQQPSVFSLVDLPLEQPLAPAAALTASAPGSPAYDPIEPDIRTTARTFDGRIYVLLMDDLQTNVARTQNVRDAARQFVQKYLGPKDLAAVVYTSGRQESGQELTGSRRLLVAAIDRFVGRKLPSANLEKLAVHLRDTDTQAVLSDPENPQPNRSQEALQRARDIKDPYDDERGFNAVQSLRAVENVATWLGDVQGRRKALVFFSEGIDYDIYQPFELASSSSSIVNAAQQAVSAAQRANVNIYPVDPRGLSQFGEMIQISGRSDYPQLEYGTFQGQLHELLLAQESLISLADETGGIPIVNAGDVVGGMGRIVLDNSRYYMLGYYSDVGKMAGKFMKIEVRLKRPGLRVRARRGYLPPDPKKLAKAREAEVQAGTSPALKAALSRPVPIGELPMRVFAAPFRWAPSAAPQPGVKPKTGKSAPDGSVLIALEIDGSALKFQEQDGRFNERIEVSIVAADEKAKVQGGDRQTFDLKLMPQTHDRVRRTGVRLMSRLDLPAGRYQLHIGASESTGSAVGTVPFDVEVPEYAKLPFGMSGLLLTAASADLYVTPNPDPLLKDVLPSSPIVNRTFRSDDTVLSFAEIYDGPGRVAHTIDVVTSVLDAATGRSLYELRDSLAAEPSAGMSTHGVKALIPLKGIAPGAYVLRVVATSAAGSQTARRAVPFDVVP